MDKYIIYETVNGHYAVRPSEWTCILNDKGQITEACNHTGLFQQKEEAEKFAEWKNAEDKGLIAQCTCKDCNKGDWSGCAEGTIYCMEHGAYFSWSDSCNKAEKYNE